MSQYKYIIYGCLLGFTLSNWQAAFAIDSLFDLDIQAISRINYEPFSGLPSSQKLAITLSPNIDQASDLQERRNTNKRLRLTIGAADNNEFLAKGRQQDLQLELLTNNQQGRFRRVKNEYQQTLRPINLNNIREQEIELTINIPESQYADAGTYRLPIDIKLLDSNTEEVLAEEQLVIEVLVAKKIYTNIAGAHTNQNSSSRFAVVNFGVLKTNDSQRVSIQVRGNSLAEVKIKSENQGRLVHQKDADLFVNYSVNVDGVASELDKPLRLVRQTDKTLAGVAYPMDIIIGDAENKFAGKYRDIITVEVRPK